MTRLILLWDLPNYFSLKAGKKATRFDLDCWIYKKNPSNIFAISVTQKKM